MFEFTKSLGAIPYIRKETDLKIGKSTAPIQIHYPYKPQAFYNTPILMQGQQSDCGGCSLSFYIAYLLKLQTQLSQRFAYGAEKTKDGVPNIDGTTIQAIGSVAKNIGVALESLYPSDITLSDEAFRQYSPTPQSLQDALTRAGWIYLFLEDLSLFGIQQAIVKYGAVLLEAEVGKEWWTAPNGANSWNAEDILPLRPPAQVVDSHFFVAGGCPDAQSIDFANSWSTEWGNNGFGTFQENYVPFIKNAMVLYKAPVSVVQALNVNQLSIAQQILNDIEQTVSLVRQELNQTT